MLGIATVWNDISPLHKTFLQKGGYGFIIGDGKLNKGLENIFETYYAASITSNFFLSFNYQLIINPGYNRDRGPASVFGVRAHIEW